MQGEEKRRSSRVVPVVSEEEAVVVVTGARPVSLAKMLDFSEVGTLVYLLDEVDFEAAVGTPCSLTLYHQGKVFTIPSKIVRKIGRLIGFDFGEMSQELLQQVQTKLLRTEVEWLRLSSRRSH